MYNDLRKKAAKEGTFIFENYTDKNGTEKKKVIGYKPNDDAKITLVVTDHRLMWL